MVTNPPPPASAVTFVREIPDVGTLCIEYDLMQRTAVWTYLPNLDPHHVYKALLDIFESPEMLRHPTPVKWDRYGFHPINGWTFSVKAEN